MVVGGGEYAGLSILGQLKSPKRRQSGRRVMSLMRVHKKVVVSASGVLGLRYARTSTIGSVLFKSSHEMRFKNRGREWGWVVL